MQNDKTKTIILLFKIQDDALDKLVNHNLTNEEENRQLYRFNVVEYIFRDLFRPNLGLTPNKRLWKENEVTYNFLEVLKNLTPFQQTLFTKEEINYNSIIQLKFLNFKK